MAILKGREVQILAKADGEDVSPTYIVLHKDGNRENVQLSQLQLTDEEFKDMSRQNGEVGMINVRKIDSKELQELRDSQDKEKIEARQKTQSPDPVAVNKVMVDPSEVQNRSVTPAKAVKK